MRIVRFLDQSEALALKIGPLIDACPRYRQPWREPRRKERRARR